jgi:hypothetical protein
MDANAETFRLTSVHHNAAGAYQNSVSSHHLLSTIFLVVNVLPSPVICRHRRVLLPTWQHAVIPSPRLLRASGGIGTCAVYSATTYARLWAKAPMARLPGPMTGPTMNEAKDILSHRDACIYNYTIHTYVHTYEISMTSSSCDRDCDCVVYASLVV